MRARAGQAAPSEANSPAELTTRPGDGEPRKGTLLRSTTRIPSPPWPGRAMALAALLGTALAIAGAGTASAATSGPVTSRAATIAHHAPTHKSAVQHLNSRPIAVDAAAAPQHGARHAAASAAPAARALTSWQAITHAAAG